MADTGWPGSASRTSSSVMAYFWTCLFLLIAELSSPAWTIKTYQCPSACECLGDLVACSKRELTAIPDDLPSWVKILDLPSNQIEDITPLASQGLLDLEKLDLSGNRISQLNCSVLVELPSLKEIKLNYNRLTELPVLPRSADITSLSLQHNEISSIDPAALDSLPRLRLLDLAYNRLKELSPDMFHLHPSLHQLYLNNNRIKKVEKGALNNLPNLTWLKLGKNKIRRLPKEVFANLSKLQDLELSKNRLQLVEGLTFTGLTSLVTLKLDRNLITELMDGAFYGPENVQNLILDHNNITMVTKGWLYGLKRLELLNLSHNRVSEIEGEVWSFCELLSKLDLRYNELRLVKEDSFARLGSLQHLLLTNNRMTYIAEEAFQGMGSLQVLELDNNEISWTIEDMNAAFSGLTSLKRLSLRNNNIQLIAKRAFEGLDYLQTLHLENNSLTSIQMNAFDSLSNLQELYINSSSLVCDCQLAWLPQWLARVGFQHMVTAKCIHPASLKGRSVMDVNVDDFKCDDSPKPVIQIQPDSQAALKGSNTSLECVAVSSDPSAFKVKWRKDNILLKPEVYEVYQRSVEDGIMEVRSVLRFQDLQDEHGGVYQCVVSNDLGTAYSARAEITVNILPYFIKTPEDVIAPIGTTAKLECKATGHPTPSIAWKKDGGDNFPAARERRILVMPTDDVFFITKVNLEDAGVYSCTASNNVGTVVANATLRVHKKPKVETQMRDKVVMRGDTAVLECMASGSPRPTVEWLKDDRPLEVSKRHFFAAERQMLLIYKTEDEDAGVYTCQVRNTLDNTQGQSRLTVVSRESSRGLDTQVVLDPETGGPAAIANRNRFGSDSMMTGIIIIAVVCCVVGTSLVWVIIIYKTRKRTEEYSSTPTDETTLPGEIPGTPFHGSDRDSNSPGVLAVARTPDAFGRYSLDVNPGFGYGNSPSKTHRAAIFPSDTQDDHTRQSVPLTSDEQQPAESSDTSINMLRRLRHSTGGSDSTPSPQHSSYSLQSSRSNVLHTFQPHLASSQLPCPQHTSPVATCDECLHGSTTLAQVHSPVVGCTSHPRLDTIISEDERDVRSSGDDRAATPGELYDSYHGSRPPGHYTDESDYNTFPSSHCSHREEPPTHHTLHGGVPRSSVSCDPSPCVGDLEVAFHPHNGPVLESPGVQSRYTPPVYPAPSRSQSSLTTPTAGGDVSPRSPLLPCQHQDIPSDSSRTPCLSSHTHLPPSSTSAAAPHIASIPKHWCPSDTDSSLPSDVEYTTSHTSHPSSSPPPVTISSTKDSVLQLSSGRDS